MNSDVLKGKWKQVQGELKNWWGRLTDDDLTQIGGSKDKLIGKIQERYGYDRARAEKEIDERLRSYDDRVPTR
jgi:uncharacterized protein YjbJ (UPF0337 family)